MLTIDLTTQQVRELSDFYNEELQQIQRRRVEILDMFRLFGWSTEKLNFAQTESSHNIDTGNTDAIEEKEQISIPTYPKPKWSQFALNKLREKNRALTRDQLLEMYRKEHKIKQLDLKTEKAALSLALNYLQVSKNQIKSKPRKGKRGHLYKIVDNEFKQAINEKITATPAIKKKKTIDIPKPEKEWIEFIIETLKHNKRILNRNEFVDYAIRHFGLNPRHKISTRGKLSKVVNYMTQVSGSLSRTKKHGKSGYFGLIDWFDDDKNLIKDYI